MTIGILDRLTLRPGQLDEWLTGFRERYLPAAQARGLTLTGVYVLPPEEVEGVLREVTVVWTVPDYRAFFAARGQAGADPAVAAFWTWSDALLERRERRIAAVLPDIDPTRAGCASPPEPAP